MKIIFYFVLAFAFGSCASTSNSSEISDIKNFQKTLNTEYLNPDESPLRGENFTSFTVHPFFPIDLKYRVSAGFEKLENRPVFEFPTSSGKSKTYKAYGTADFILDGKKYELTIYQSQDLIKIAEYKDHLFLPFGDLTNNEETYGGGKYLDLKIPKTDQIILDFNQSYQPFCAYNAYDYSCPIVPQQNKLPVRIEAGVKYLNTYFEN